MVVLDRQTVRLRQPLCKKRKGEKKKTPRHSAAQFVANVFDVSSVRKLRLMVCLHFPPVVFAQRRGLSNFNNSPCLSELVHEIFNFLQAQDRVLKVARRVKLPSEVQDTN